MQVGNAEEGFTIDIDNQVRAVNLRMWGFWGSEVAGALLPRFIQVCKVTPATAHTLVIDATGLKPQREAGQAAFASLMATLRELNIHEVSITTDTQLTRLQLLRIAKERCALYDMKITSQIVKT